MKTAVDLCKFLGHEILQKHCKVYPTERMWEILLRRLRNLFSTYRYYSYTCEFCSQMRAPQYRTFSFQPRCISGDPERYEYVTWSNAVVFDEDWIAIDGFPRNDTLYMEVERG